MSDSESEAPGLTRALARYGPGVVLTVIVALAARYFEEVGIAPALIIALILGLLLSGLLDKGVASAGIEFSATHILGIGVALLGARLTLADVVSLGPETAILVVAAMMTVLIASMIVARMLGLSNRIGILAGCGTAVCGASATVAASAVLRPGPGSEHDTALVVISVTVLSAVVMVLYPLAIGAFGLSDIEAGIVLGGSIHNVPQAVAAGFTVSETAGNTATLTKLFRVALLGPIVVAIALLAGNRTPGRTSRVGVPWFIVVFAVLILIGSVMHIPFAIRSALNHASGWLLLIAVAAIGLKTPVGALRKVGPRVLVLIVINSLALVAVLTGAAISGLAG